MLDASQADSAQLSAPPTVGRKSQLGQTKKPFVAFCWGTGGPAVNDYMRRMEWLESHFEVAYHDISDLTLGVSAGALAGLAGHMPDPKTGQVPPACQSKIKVAKASQILMRPSLYFRELRLLSSRLSRDYFQAAWGDQPLSAAKSNIGVYTASSRKKRGVRTHILKSYAPFKEGGQDFRHVPAFRAAAATKAIPYACRPEKIDGFNMYDPAGIKALPFYKTITQALKMAEPGQLVKVVVMTPGNDDNQVPWLTRRVFSRSPRTQIEIEIAKVCEKFSKDKYPHLEIIIVDPHAPSIIGRGFPRILDLSEEAISFSHHLGIAAMEQCKVAFENLKAQRGLSCAHV
ncbi:MAG: hypothetical protein AAF569_00715 [Pseudomonadota bacterium]